MIGATSSSGNRYRAPTRCVFAKLTVLSTGRHFREFNVLQRLIAFTFSLVMAANLNAQESGRPLLIVYDSSNSMWGELTDNSRKYQAGRNALAKLLSSNLSGRSIGLRPYGHRVVDDCRDTELLVPFGRPSDVKEQFAKAVNGIRPTGSTPISYSLRQGLSDLGEDGGDILLISDGIETCDIDPCELMREWRDADVNVRVHVVGVGLNELERGAMQCIADTSGGEYFDADTQANFESALADASTVIDSETDADPVQTDDHYALILVAKNAEGRSFLSTGSLTATNGDELSITTNGRNVLPGPGEYQLEAGPVLRDGTVYLPVSKPVVVDSPGETVVEIEVQTPAMVVASFTEAGEEHRGAHVYAWQADEEIFSFRRFDEALARPGDYRFTSQPNDDNHLSVDATLVAGERTTLDFQLVQTNRLVVRYQLPNEEVIDRHSELWRNGEKVYTVYSKRGSLVLPGTYELRSDDQNVPLTPVTIDVPNEDTELIVPLAAGFLRVTYADRPYDYSGKPSRAFVESVERGGSAYTRPGDLYAVAPGTYRINPFTSTGYFPAAKEVTVAAAETVEVVVEPLAVGEIIVTYAPSEHFLREPDRASVEPEEGQSVLSGFMRPGVAKKFLPGRYRVEGYSYAGNFDPVYVDVSAGELTEAVLIAKPPAE